MFLGWLKVFVFQSFMYTEDQIPLKFISELLMRKLEQTERKKKLLLVEWKTNSISDRRAKCVIIYHTNMYIYKENNNNNIKLLFSCYAGVLNDLQILA